MIATDSFYMRMSPTEKAMLEAVAQHFQRTQADTLKTFVRETYRLMQAEKVKAKSPTHKPAVSAA